MPFHKLLIFSNKGKITFKGTDLYEIIPGVQFYQQINCHHKRMRSNAHIIFGIIFFIESLKLLQRALQKKKSSKTMKQV